MPQRLHQNGFVTVAAVSPALRLADPGANADLVIQALGKAAAEGAEVIVLPELCLIGYTCGDLIPNRSLLEGSLLALRKVAEATQKLGVTALIGCQSKSTDVSLTAPPLSHVEKFSVSFQRHTYQTPESFMNSAGSPLRALTQHKR